jgi:proteic killer suppression protein
MLISFATDKLKKLCLQEREAKKALGDHSARKLRTRLAELDAAAHVGELVFGGPHPLKADRAGQFAVDLHGGQRLVFEPDHEPIPTKDDGSIDWARVSAVRIVYLGDYHD